MSDCPGEDTLAAFAIGGLKGSALTEVTDHAVRCTACTQQLMAANVELWDAPDVGATPMEAPQAELLNGRYMLMQKLGEGGMGVVYEAEDLMLGERVALKTLRVELACDERALGYLKSEARLARQIGHEHVCRVYDLGSQTTAGVTLHYITMELLRGPSLRRLLQEGALDQGLVLRLADQVLRGLQAAHAAGVLHRDLKPDNMLLRHASPQVPHAVITDFGLARAFQAGQRHVSASRLLVGSAAYLAPEQMEEAQLTEATDLYSFGVVLFELLTGELPFCAKTPLGLALRRLHTPAPRPSTVRPELGQRYDAFVLRCLARDPRERFQSAASARAALKKLIDGSHAEPRRLCGARGRSALGAALITLCSAGLALGLAPEAAPLMAAHENTGFARGLPPEGSPHMAARDSTRLALGLPPEASPHTAARDSTRFALGLPPLTSPRTSAPDSTVFALGQRAMCETTRLAAVAVAAKGSGFSIPLPAAAMGEAGTATRLCESAPAQLPTMAPPTRGGGSPTRDECEAGGQAAPASQRADRASGRGQPRGVKSRTPSRRAAAPRLLTAEGFFDPFIR